jgi:hypothetical protein
MKFISWPRGKYNGRKIEGFKITFAIHILAWRLIPLLLWNFGEPVFIWLCFTVRGYIEYDYSPCLNEVFRRRR